MTATGPQTRISDADRERAMADLAGHYAEGRLDHEEYDERLDAIWTARTRSDLAILFSDMPRTPAPQVVRTPAPRRPAGRRLRLPFLPVLALLIGLSILTGAPVWLLIFPLMFFMGRRRGMACAPSHPHMGHADYRRPRGSHGW